MQTKTKPYHLEWLARTGYSARGVVYLVVGWLALAAAWEYGRATDTKGALLAVMTADFGKGLLGMIALGLIGFSIWRLVQAIGDADRHGTDARGLAVRSGLLASAVTYGLLAVFAVSLIFGWGTGGQGDSDKQEWTARLLALPFGQWLVVGVGLIVVGVGVAHGYKAYTAGFKRHFDMDADTMKKASPICRFGLAARGVVFLIVGGFLILAAWYSDPSKTRGLSGALRALQDQPYGWLAMAVVALGLIAFGIYSLIEAVYRRIGEPEQDQRSS